jgi:lipoprotein-releasing system permease protein
LRHSPFLEKQGLVLNGQRALPMQIRGIDPLLEKNIVKIRQSIPQDVFASLQSGSQNVVVGSEVAVEYDLNIGKKLTLVIPKSGNGQTLGAPDVASFTVSGILQTRDHKSNESMIYLHLQDLQQFVGLPASALSGYQVALPQMDNAPEIAQRLRAALPKSLRVLDWQQKNAAQYKAVKFEKLLMTIMLCVIILISGLNIIITTIMTVNAKRGEIAILMTMGASDASIARVFITNGFILGIGGIICGIAAGVAIAPNIGNIIARLERWLSFRVFDPTVLDIVHIPSRLEGGDVMLVALVAFCVAMIATILPALHAARINPVEAFRYE